MKVKKVSILLVIVALILAGIFVYTAKRSKDTTQVLTRAKIITPKSSETAEADSEKIQESIQDEGFDTFIELAPTETLISSSPIDFNDDGFDDEVDIIRKAGNQAFTILPCLYNPETSSYERLAEIQTKISRTRTFSYNGMDVTGEHKTALIYQGIDDDGNYVMKLFHSKVSGSGETTLVSIGDFTSDGTIFIQQTERSESYELSLSKGESYSVWVYESEKITSADGKVTSGQNQIQKEYKWNSAVGQYELNREIKVTAGKLAANEVSKIQDGTVETFAAFLDGLWYKTDNEDSDIRYMFFDYGKNEIIQLYQDTQEVYEWEDSKIRHNGIYLSTVNSDITNLQRRFDITLVNASEIKLTLHDAINLSIKENSMWDGNYRKLSLQNSFENQNEEKENVYQQELLKTQVWKSIDDMQSLSLKDNVYTFTNQELTEQGIYSFMVTGTHNVLEFRSNSEISLLNSTYAMQFGTKIVTETKKKKTTEKVVTDYDTIIFTPVKITPTDCFVSDGKVYTFVRNQ